MLFTHTREVLVLLLVHITVDGSDVTGGRGNGAIRTVYIKSLVERVPGIRYQLVGFVGPGPFLGQLGHDACVLGTRPLEHI